jgi:hypothetical protein
MNATSKEAAGRRLEADLFERRLRYALDAGLILPGELSLWRKLYRSDREAAREALHNRWEAA